MAEKFQNKYRIPSSRLQGFDYGSHASYFVTICTKNKIHYFGEIVNTHNVETHHYASLHCPSLCPTDIGKIAFDFWAAIPEHYPFVVLDEFVIMPNHIHGILCFNRPGKTDRTPNIFGAQSQNLGAVIRAYKSSVKRYANQHNIAFEWQPRFYDRIIRDERARQAIRNYIINNPQNWYKDQLNNSIT